MSGETPREPSPPPSSGSQPVYVTYPPDEDTRIDVMEAARVLWRGKWLIAVVTFLFAAAGVAYALLATPVYRGVVVLAPNKSEQGPNLTGSLGGLASLAGINLGYSPDETEAIATLYSRVFIEEFIRDNDLLPILFADKWDAANGRWMEEDPEDRPDILDGVGFFIDEVRSVEEDSVTGLITLAVEWTDPQLVADWAEDLVRRINERLRARDLANSERRLAYLNSQLEKASLVELRQAISRLIENEIQTIMLAQADEEYAFKVIDPPRVPSEPIAPRKLSIVVLATFIGGMVGVFLATWAAAAARRAGK